MAFTLIVGNAAQLIIRNTEDERLGQGFEDVFAQYGSLLSRVANSYEANHALQQELLQEIAIAVWQGLTRFKGDSSVKTCLLYTSPSPRD